MASKKKKKSKHKNDNAEGKDLATHSVKRNGVNKDRTADADDGCCRKEKKRKRKLDRETLVEDQELKQDAQEPSKKKKKSKGL